MNINSINKTEIISKIQEFLSKKNLHTSETITKNTVNEIFKEYKSQNWDKLVGADIFKMLKSDVFSVGEFINVQTSLIEKTISDLSTINSVIQDNQKVLENLHDDRKRQDVNRSHLSLKENIQVSVYRVENIDQLDPAHTSNTMIDSHISVQFGDQLLYKTNTVSNSVSPIFNESFKMELDDGMRTLIKEERDFIKFIVVIEDASSDREVGEFKILIKSLKDQKEHQQGSAQVTRNGVAVESCKMEVNVMLTWDYYSKNEDRIIALNNTVQRSADTRKRLKTKVELLWDPLVPKNALQKTIMQGESIFVSKSEEVLTNLNKNQALNQKKVSILGFQIQLCLTILACMYRPDFVNLTVCAQLYLTISAEKKFKDQEMFGVYLLLVALVQDAQFIRVNLGNQMRFKGGLEDTMRFFSIWVSIASFGFKVIYSLVFYLHIVKVKDKMISGKNRVLQEEANFGFDD